ncbi:unnamed protein product [Caenorhabditis auriculariae]|uniref:Uncharacterized protein n=1 Tax=Caenorhabditis auriculariae TaxID=2777116 RepID=A0A8S1GQ63_9PELO|nr:unnamed protein product [Caenorhabditis auriculariae]
MTKAIFRKVCRSEVEENECLKKRSAKPHTSSAWLRTSTWQLDEVDKKGLLRRLAGPRQRKQGDATAVGCMANWIGSWEKKKEEGRSRRRLLLSALFVGLEKKGKARRLAVDGDLGQRYWQRFDDVIRCRKGFGIKPTLLLTCRNGRTFNKNESRRNLVGARALWHHLRHDANLDANRPTMGGTSTAAKAPEAMEADFVGGWVTRPLAPAQLRLSPELSPRFPLLLLCTPV